MAEQGKSIQSIYPLSPMQQGMLFHTLFSPKSGVYFNQILYTLTGELQKTAMQRAWQQVMDRHEPLRTLFVWEQQEKPLQVVRRRVMLSWEELDWRGFSADEQSAKLAAFLQADRQRGFDLAQAPLMRLALIRLEESHYELIWSHHHLLMDGWSSFLILKDVRAIYQALSEGRDYRLEPLRPYRDYINWLQGQDLSKAEGFWRAALKGFAVPTPLLGSPVDVGHEDQDYKTAERLGNSSPLLMAALRSFGRQHDLTLSTLVHGAWALLLSRYSGERDIVFGSTVSGRAAELAGVESMVGLFINTLPVRAQFSPQDLTLAWLKDLQSKLVELRQYEYSPIVEMQGWSDVRRDHPLFESLLVFENYPVDASVWGQDGALQISNMRVIGPTNYPLTLVVVPRKELSIRVSYDSRRFNVAAVSRMLGHFNTLLERIVANPEGRLSDLPLLTSAERHQLLVGWNQTQQNYPEDKCVHELFEEQVERTPAGTAVIFEDKQLTYRKLNERANQLARHLCKLGVRPNMLVGICVERSLELVIGILGILKAGGAYVPMDPEYPKDRLAFILQDAKASVLLTQKKFIGKLVETGAQLVCVDGDGRVFESENQQNLHTNVGSENLIYAIYTSGSTGIPKGASVCHRGFTNLMHWFVSEFAIGSSDSVLLVSSLSFDLTQKNIYAPLICGGKLHLASAGPYDPGLIVDTICRSKITLLNCTPSAFYPLIESADHPWFKSLSSLRSVFLGGEPISIQRLRPWLESGSCQTEVVNTYGPTECTDIAAYYRLNRASLNKYDSVPIGEPISNVQLAIVDKDLQLCPAGVTGELCVAGVGVGAGYLNNAELTASKFVANPFSELFGQKLYKTGDLARHMPDGAIEYLGRMDNQVKIRGFRIELGEIESVLAELRGVLEAVVVAREDVPGDKRLVAYLTSCGGEAPEDSELRRQLKDKLPDYMVPSTFVTLDGFPLTPNGKLDRKALPAPERKKVGIEQGYVAPTTYLEQVLCRVWCKLLNLTQVGTRDNFFDLGGYSILALRVLGEINKTLNVRLNVPTFFQNPTIGQLAKVLEQTRHFQPKRQVVTLQHGHTGLPLYLIDAGMAEQRIAQLIAGDRAIFAIDIPMPVEWRHMLSAANGAALPNIEQLGALYGGVLREHAGSSPCVVVGCHFGGKIAFEAARVLQSAGGNVALVVLIDASAGSAGTRHLAWQSWRWIWHAATATADDTTYMDRLSALLRHSWRLLRWLLKRLPSVVKARLAPSTFNMTNNILDTEGIPVELGLMQRFRRVTAELFHPLPLKVPGVLLRAELPDEEMLPGLDRSNGWRGLFTKGLEVVQMAGGHVTMVSDEHAAAFTCRINEVLDRYDLTSIRRGEAHAQEAGTAAHRSDLDPSCFSRKVDDRTATVQVFSESASC